MPAIDPNRTGSLAGIPNLRDVGGLPTADGGLVRTGLMYRGPAIGELTNDQLAGFTALGIRTVYDLRTVDERTAAPDELPEGMTYVSVDVLGDEQPVSHRKIMGLIQHPETATEVLGGGRGTAIWLQQSRNLIALPSARAGYGRVLRDVTDQAHRPVMVHCSTGKDRTGWAVAALLTLLGVPDELITADYMRSNVELEERLERMFARFAAAGGDAELLATIMVVHEEFLDEARNEMRREFGSVEAYFAEALGIDEAGQAELRATFIEPAPGARPDPRSHAS